VSSGIDLTRTLRGALSGALAATVWALEQPLDKRIFRSSFDDVELLGKLVRRDAGWYPIGFAMHVANGAAFGAVYANLAPRLGLPAPLRGPAAALAENFASWPLVAITDRAHPARDELPQLSGSRSAAQLSAHPDSACSSEPCPLEEKNASESGSGSSRRPGAICCSASSSVSSNAA
jgi:hypothetical protein